MGNAGDALVVSVLAWFVSFWAILFAFSVWGAVKYQKRERRVRMASVGAETGFLGGFLIASLTFPVVFVRNRL